MTEQVIEQAVAEHPTLSETVAQEVPDNTISQAVNGSEPTSSGNNTTAETKAGEGAVAESPAAVEAEKESSEGAVAESSAPVEAEKESSEGTVAESPAPVEAEKESSQGAVAESPAAVEAEKGSSDGVVAESPATVESKKTATASEDTTEEDKPKRKRRRKKRKKRRKLETYTVGDELEGVVRSVQPYGAFIDVGAERDGLIHISELREGYVEKVEDVIKERDKVVIRVKEVNVETGRLSLTMLSPESIEAQKEPKKKRIHLRYLEEGQELVGRVNSIVDFGAFIDIGATTDGLVHISQMSEDHISSVSDFLKEGEEIKVRILSIDKKRKRISLTMREEQTQEEEQQQYRKRYEREPQKQNSSSRRIVNEMNDEDNGDEEGLPSLMAIAFARANARKQRKGKDSKKNKNNKQNGNIDDIVSRMLDKHRAD